MGHDELRDFIDKFDAAGMVDEPAVKALRAVVELHKVLLVKDYENDTHWYECQECKREISPSIPYPCPTIQAIEKEFA